MFELVDNVEQSAVIKVVGVGGGGGNAVRHMLSSDIEGGNSCVRTRMPKLSKIWITSH